MYSFSDICFISNPEGQINNPVIRVQIPPLQLWSVNGVNYMDVFFKNLRIKDHKTTEMSKKKTPSGSLMSLTEEILHQLCPFWPHRVPLPQQSGCLSIVLWNCRESHSIRDGKYMVALPMMSISWKICVIYACGLVFKTVIYAYLQDARLLHNGIAVLTCSNKSPLLFSTHHTPTDRANGRFTSC